MFTRMLTLVAVSMALVSSLYSQCNTTISSYPFLESFEQGLSDFTNEMEFFCQPIDFVVGSGQSPNAGPSAAVDGTNYVFVPLSTNPNSNGECNTQSVSLLAPCFDLTSLSNPELRFWYYGERTIYARILVQSSRDGGLTWEGFYPDITPFTFFEYFNRPTGWNEVVIDLSAYSSEADYRFRIGVEGAYVTPMDVAIDGISVGEALCPNAPQLSASTGNISGAGNSDANVDVTVSGGQAPFSFQWSNGAVTEDLTGLDNGRYAVTVTDANGCNDEISIYVADPLPCKGTKNGGWPYEFDFETNGLGQLRQNKGDNRNWKRWSGDTPTALTGPPGSNVAPYEGPQYRYIEASGAGSPFKTAVLTTKKCLNLTSITQPGFQMLYHMAGFNQGTLEVQASGDGGQTWSETLWRMSGNQGIGWQRMKLDLSVFNTGQTRIRIVGQTGDGELSDMALDYYYIGDLNTTPYRPAAEGNSFFDNLAAIDLTDAGLEELGEENTTTTTNPENNADRSTTKAFNDQVFTQEGLRLSPNPAAAGSPLTIQFSMAMAGQARIYLRKMDDGQPLVEVARRLTKGNQRLTMDLPDVPAGVYYIEVITPNNRFIQAIVLQP